MANDANELSPNLRRLISCTAIADGSRPEWKFGFDKYVNSTLPNEKTELLRAITCTVNVTILNEMLVMMITNNSDIRLQDASTLFSNIAANPVGHQVAMDFLTNRWNETSAYFGGFQGFGGGTMARLFRSLCNRVNTQAKLNQLKKLRSDHPAELGSSKSVSQGMEVAEANVLWVQQHYDTIVNWLKSQQSAATTQPTVATTPSTVATTPSTASSVYLDNFSALIMAVLAGFWSLTRFCLFP
ncbi:aminopeptidase N-like [Daphnia pulicaria]|uniref:aminopeptidase N-like n=1 Tax=Daphnia pulicaria TaxID=35523 RepID=UPI001EEA338E|nr:aminopeptidase N-like [Daphnia pulicaria]